MLTRANYGLHLTGRIDAVTPVQHRQGTAKNGNPYSFFQQTICISVGGEMFEVGYRADEDPKGPLANVELDEVVRIKVKNPRLYGGKISFDADQAA